MGNHCPEAKDRRSDAIIPFREAEIQPEEGIGLFFLLNFLF